ncbi:MAG TPA: hypothetical protein VF753_13825 [Terriglobales bacterium]
MASNEPIDSSGADLASATIRLEEAVRSGDLELLKAAVASVALSEDLALVLLKRAELPAEILEQLSKRPAGKHRKVQLALVAHPKTPRYVSMAIVRQMFTFDLMQAALMPIVPADVKKSAEEALLHRLEKLTLGERLTLAKRASGRVAGELLLDSEGRVSQTALDNARLTEAHIVKALTGAKARASLVHAICTHSKWPLRRDIRIALLRNEKLPLTYAMEYALGLPAKTVREILQASRLPAHVKQRVLDAING